MKRFFPLFFITGILVYSPLILIGGTIPEMPVCHDHSQLTQELQSLRQAHPDRLRLSALAESREGRTIWMVEAGLGRSPEMNQRPGILIVAGIEGGQIAGTECALDFIHSLVQDGETPDILRSILEKNVIYIIPRFNPDAAEFYFRSPLREQAGNMTPFDTDHDGLIDEDGPDDMNGDGLITHLRVQDSKGTLIPHPQEERILVEADAFKEETGAWLLFSEGKDDDQDKKINEDGIGEVNFNKNFPYNYLHFDPQAGLYPACEKETHALAEFVVSHPNLAVVFTFSPPGTLLKTPESGDRTPGNKPQVKILKEDAKLYDFLGKEYRKQMGIEKELEISGSPGNLADWIYYDRGRLALSAPVWSPEIALALQAEKKESEPKQNESKSSQSTDEIKSASQDQPGDQENEKKEEDKRAQVDRDYLKWVEKNAPGYFISWQAVEDSDYPGQKAEVGGFAPYAKSVPPANRLDELKKKNSAFLIWLTQKLPRIEIPSLEGKSLGNGVYEITARIRNAGFLPTVLAHGERTTEVIPTRVILDFPKEKILAGNSIKTIGPLAGNGGIEEIHWVVQSPGNRKITVQAVSALAGRAEKTIELGGEGEE